MKGMHDIKVMIRTLNLNYNVQLIREFTMLEHECNRWFVILFGNSEVAIDPRRYAT